MRSPSILQVLFIVSMGVFKPAFAADGNDPIVGRWKWFTKETKTFLADGTITPGGTWKCVNPGESPHKYVIVWGNGKFVDTMVLEKDESHLSGHNQKGVRVSGNRLSREDVAAVSNAPATVGDAPVAATNASVAATNAPAAVTNAPVAVTNAPVAVTNAPVAVTNAPVAVTNAPAAVTNAPATVNPSTLTEPLAPYIRNLEVLLSLRRVPNKDNKAFLAQASGRLITVRQEIVVKREKASGQKTAPFDAALKTCDLISAALAERSNVLGDLKASGAVVNDGRLEEQARKDNLVQGIRGDGFAKAVGSIVERDREREANKKAARRAASTDNALTAMTENNWNKRSAEWMQQIAAAYGGIQ